MKYKLSAFRHARSPSRRRKSIAHVLTVAGCAGSRREAHFSAQSKNQSLSRPAEHPAFIRVDTSFSRFAEYSPVLLSHNPSLAGLAGEKNKPQREHERSTCIPLREQIRFSAFAVPSAEDFEVDPERSKRSSAWAQIFGGRISMYWSASGR